MRTQPCLLWKLLPSLGKRSRPCQSVTLRLEVEVLEDASSCGHKSPPRCSWPEDASEQSFPTMNLDSVTSVFHEYPAFYTRYSVELARCSWLEDASKQSFPTMKLRSATSVSQVAACYTCYYVGLTPLRFQFFAWIHCARVYVAAESSSD